VERGGLVQELTPPPEREPASETEAGSCPIRVQPCPSAPAPTSTAARVVGEIASGNAQRSPVTSLFVSGANVVDVYVAAVRRKLGPNVIETVRGKGYRVRVTALGDADASTGFVRRDEVRA
jgi:hypothetical protein